MNLKSLSLARVACRFSEAKISMCLMRREYINRIYSIHKFVRSGDIIKYNFNRNMHEAGLNFSLC